MKCLECKGACCESFTVEVRMLPPIPDAQRWIDLHATTIVEGKQTFECRCTKLTSGGLCSIHEDRPLTCELYIAGSRECLDTVRLRRTPEDYQRIRDEEDPACL